MSRSNPSTSTPLINALMIGTGEYTTGYVHGAASSSDKGAGVVALTLFDLRRQGILNELSMAGTNGTKFPGIREHLSQVIEQRYHGLSTSLTTYPKDSVSRNPEAYLEALNQMSPGDAVIIFTPDDTHFKIALAAIDHGCHVLIAKPIVKTVAEHQRLIQAADSNGVIAAMEVHKRWDPIYTDARDRIRNLGEFSYFSSYMSQPKSQLETFRAWAGKSSDISYYLNAHHVDFNVWAIGNAWRPVSVTAVAASGVAQSQGIETEDTITLATQWEHSLSGARACATYTASWIAPRSDVHSQQRFHYMGATGEIQIDQAHRGYSLSTDANGFQSPNPLFMKYDPSETGEFAGQSGYGYRSIEDFIRACGSIRVQQTRAADYTGRLATVQETLPVTAILEAGRRSLDNQGKPISIRYAEDGKLQALA